MDALYPLSTAALLTAALLMFSLIALRRRQRSTPSRAGRDESLDTVAGWPPEVARVLTLDERQAFDLLVKAVPGTMVLAQVPLSRFVRVPTRHSYADWHKRAGQLAVDLLLCDQGSRVLVAVDIRSASETERSRRRHERLERVLAAAGVPVMVWTEGRLPSINEVRKTVSSLLSADDEPAMTGAMPLIPVPEISEILAEGDALDRAMEPVSSGFFDDLEAAGASRL